MANHLKIKKGLDIPLDGALSGKSEERLSGLFAVVPSDFPGYTWKVAVKEGDTVSPGSRLLYAKEAPELALTSPVGGKVEEIKRGERRRIEHVSVRRDPSVIGEKSKVGTSREELLAAIQGSGLFALIRQRPFDIVPSATVVPRDIFITGFDSAPLAPSLMNDNVSKYLDAGLAALKRLTSGKVYLSMRPGSTFSTSNAEVYEIEGPHPAGNVGVQIANIAPVNKGETVWTLDVTAAARIGRFVKEGDIDYSTEVAVVGPLVKNPVSVRTFIGASIKSLIEGNVERPSSARIISGNVLTGERVDAATGFLRFPYRQITVISEGNDADEFMGWASMNPRKFSVKRTFPAFLRGLGKSYDFDARVKGGHRAMILSGEYDKVFPMDILPEYLVKAIIAKDIDKMEQLGIYEVAPEDFALPEFVDTSKLELQKIVRDGLDYLRKETT